VEKERLRKKNGVIQTDVKQALVYYNHTN